MCSYEMIISINFTHIYLLNKYSSWHGVRGVGLGVAKSLFVSKILVSNIRLRFLSFLHIFVLLQSVGIIYMLYSPE